MHSSFPCKTPPKSSTGHPSRKSDLLKIKYIRPKKCSNRKRPAKTGGSITQSNLGANWVRYVNLRLRILDHLQDKRTPAQLRRFDQFLFDSIRVLYEHDPKAALDFHQKELPADFKPVLSPTTGSTYLRLYALFGFRSTQRLWARFH